MSRLGRRKLRVVAIGSNRNWRFGYPEHEWSHTLLTPLSSSHSPLYPFLFRGYFAYLRVYSSSDRLYLYILTKLSASPKHFFRFPCPEHKWTYQPLRVNSVWIHNMPEPASSIGGGNKDSHNSGRLRRQEQHRWRRHGQHRQCQRR